MPITTECPLCATKGLVPSSFNGKRVKCPKCCNLFLVSGPTSASFAGNQKIPGSHPGNQTPSGSHPGTVKPGAAQQGTVKPGSTHHGIAKPGGTQQGIMPKPGSSHQGNKKVIAPSKPPQKNDVRRAAPTQEMQLEPGKLDQMIARRQAASQFSTNGSSRKGKNPLPLVVGTIALLLGLTGAAIFWMPDVASIGMWLGLAGLAVGGLGYLIGHVMKSGKGLSLAACVLCAIALIGGLAVSLLAGDGKEEKKADENKPADTAPAKENRPDPKPEPPPPVVEEWVVVPAGSARVGDMRVRVTAAEIDSVKGKDGKPLDPKLQQFVVKIVVENGGKDKVTYRGAGDQATKVGEGAPRLTDDQGTPYRVVTFGKDKPIVGQLESTAVEPTKSVNDVLVFDRPNDKSDFYKLELPGVNFGGAGKLKLKIPKAFVVAKVAPPPPPPPPDEKNIQQLLAELKNANPGVRINAAQRLGEAGAKAMVAIPDLSAALKDGDFNVRAAMAEAIGKIGGNAAETVPLLVNVLKDPIPKVRASAAQALGHFGAAGKPAVPALIGAFTDPDEEVSHKALEAVKRIEGK